ncbi:MAG: 3-deoxy-manno-octulosonate cytidylyltransferase [Planctomycetota bacterium]|nr:3-deoxy-manno-octulosonate cytidylyltransferase [Planctomycetota bacterium]
MVIPARLESRRFPRKVLANETGKYLVQHVWEAVRECPGISRVIVATDSEEVARAVGSFGGEAFRTSPDHVSGTDRVAEVARQLSEDIVINLQGDEPLITHRDIRQLIDLFDEPPGGTWSAGPIHMTTLVSPRTDHEGFHDPNIVKAVIGRDGRALYFSRSAVPVTPLASQSPAGGRERPSPSWLQHIGLYGYRRDFVLRFSELEPTPLEKRERLEQLRALENGFVIRVGEARGRHVGIDTEGEYRSFVEDYLREKSSPLGVSSR